MPRSPLTPEFSYDERALRYRDIGSGRFVSQRAVLGSLNSMITAGQGNIENITQSLIDGDINVTEWRSGMAREIKIMHAASAAAAKGGWAQMSPADWGREGSLVKKQYQWLDNFAQEIVSGKQPLDGRAMQRARMYAQAGRGTFEEIRRNEHKTMGYTEERRVLGAAEHCPGCVEQASLGWQPIGTLDPIGAEQCRTFCVVGETLIQSPGIEAVYNRHYEGLVIELETSNGSRLTVTPNHPLLTDRGWVGAQFVNEDDCLIGGVLRKKMLFGNPNVYDVPTPIANIFTALRDTNPHGLRRIVGSDIQFHGDGKATDVHVVFTDLALMNKRKPAFVQPLHKLNFSPADMMIFLRSAALKYFFGIFLAAPGFVRFADICDFFSSGHFRIAHQLSFVTPPNSNAGLFEPVSYNIPRHIASQADGLLTFAKDVTMNKVIGKSERIYVGHVYNLQTKTEWYIANGIISHNCQCTFDYQMGA